MFTDTIEEINGVAAVLQPLVAFADAQDWPFTMVSCGAERLSKPHHEMFRALDRFSFDVYEEFPLLRAAGAAAPALVRGQRRRRDPRRHARAARHGSRLIARTLGLPLVASYHTDLPRLGYFLTGDHIVRESLWTYVRGFYNQAEIVFCPSRAVQDDLAQHGVRARFENLDQAIDSTLFMPGRRNEEVRRVLGGGKKVMLWVGRMSPEKGLDFLALAYNRLRRQRDDVRLVLVGDGPYREQLAGAAARAPRSWATAPATSSPRSMRRPTSSCFRGGPRPSVRCCSRRRRRACRRSSPPASASTRTSRRDETALVVAPGDATRLRRRHRAPARRRTRSPAHGRWPPASAPCSAAGRRPSATCARSTASMPTLTARRQARGRRPSPPRRTEARPLPARPPRRRGLLRRPPAARARQRRRVRLALGDGRRPCARPPSRRRRRPRRCRAALGLPPPPASTCAARPARRRARRGDRRRAVRGSLDGARRGDAARRLRAGLRGRPSRPRRGQPRRRAAPPRRDPALQRVRVPPVPARAVRHDRVQSPLPPPAAPATADGAAARRRATSPCAGAGAGQRKPARALGAAPARRWRAGRAGGGPNRPAPCPPTTTRGRPTPGRLLYEFYTPWRFARWSAAAAASSVASAGARADSEGGAAGAQPARRRAAGDDYGRGTNPMRSRTFCIVRSAIAEARSAPSRSTSRVKPLSALSSVMRRWKGARASTTTSARSFLNWA